MKNIIFGLQVVLIFSFTSCKQSFNDNESLISFTDQADTNTDQADTNNSDNAASNNEYDNTPVQFAMGSLEIIHTLNDNSPSVSNMPVGFALSEDESKGVFRLPKSDGSGQAELMLKDFNTSTVNRITEQSDASDIIVHGSGSYLLGGWVGVSGPGNVYDDKSFLNLSDDGRYSYFNAHADSTFPDSNTNSPSIIYRKDLQTGDLDVVSDSANGHSDVQYITSKDSISDNGRYIVFTARSDSSGSNGVLNDMFPGEAPANSTMAYLKDMVTNNIELVSKRLDGTAMTSDLNTTAFPGLVSGGAIPNITFATTSNDGNVVHYVVNYDTSYDFETSIDYGWAIRPRPTVVRYDIEKNERIVINPNNSLGSGHGGQLNSLFSSSDGMVSSYVNTTGVVYYNHREGQLKDALVDENNNQLELSNMKYRVCDISPDGRFLGIISNNTALSGLTGSDSQQLYLKNLTTGEFQVVTYNSSNELFVEYVFNCQFTKDSKKITFTTKGNHYEGQDGSEYKFYRRQFRD